MGIYTYFLKIFRPLDTSMKICHAKSVGQSVQLDPNLPYLHGDQEQRLIAL
jgi:hypothetical protein